MKRLILALLALAALAPVAHAASDTPGAPAILRNGYYYNATPGVNRTDANGVTLTYDQGPAAWVFFSKMYSDTISTAGKNADSSGVYPLPTIKRRALLIYPLGVTAVAGTAMHVALEIRGHFQSSSDSSSTFTFARFSGANARWPTGVTAAADSIGHVGSIPLPATSGAAGTVTPSEVVLTVRPDVNQMLTKGIMMPIPDDFAPYISVRLRVLDQLTSTGGAGLKRGRFDITLVGSPQ